MAVGDKIRSPVWGNVAYEITQEFGTYSPDTAAMYPADYTEPLGYPAGTHIGLDVGVPKNTRLFALNPGRVIEAHPNDISQFFRPKPVYILTEDNPNTKKDESGYVEIYGHMWTNAVSSGQKVKPGQFLGTSGEQTYIGTMNPDGTGEHLHFELRKPQGDGSFRAVRPNSWLTESQTEPSDEPETPSDTPSETPSNGIPSLTGLGSLVSEIGQRSTFVIIGIVLLAIGAYAVIKA